jgi:hypothetical protein
MAEDADHHAKHSWRGISSLLNKCLKGIGILIKLYVLHSIEVELNFSRCADTGVCPDDARIYTFQNVSFTLSGSEMEIHMQAFF